MIIGSTGNQLPLVTIANNKSTSDTEINKKDSVITAGSPDQEEAKSKKLQDFAKNRALKGMSKVELHRHLEGSFTPEMIIKVAEKYNIQLPTHDPEKLRPYVQITPEDKTLVDFLKKFELLGKLFVSKEAISDLTYEVIKEANKDNVKYMELRFSPLTMSGCGKKDGSPPLLDPQKDAMEGVLDGVKRAASSFDTDVNLILIASRKLRLDGAMKTLEIAKNYKDRGITSIDLAGDEAHYPPEEFVPFFLEAEKEGFYTTGHGSEALGPDSARTLKNEGHVDRVGHGVRILQDSTLEKQAAAEGWALELCPTSNEQTGAVPKLDKENYPFDRYDKEGIKVTINTDDPGVCGVTLTDEYKKVMDLYGYDLEKMNEINLRGADVAFLPEDKKQHLKERLIRDNSNLPGL